MRFKSVFRESKQILTISWKPIEKFRPQNLEERKALYLLKHNRHTRFKDNSVFL